MVIKKISCFIVAIVILSNVPPVYGFFRLIFDSKHYRYSNSDGSFTSYEFMGRRFDTVKNMHSSCLGHDHNITDKTLYRLFSKNPLAFWRWRLYFFDERYKLPYKDWRQIEKIRETEKKETMGCARDF